MDEIQLIEQITTRIMQKLKNSSSLEDTTSQYSCQICQDRELVLVPDNDGFWTECSCVQQKRFQRRIKSRQLDTEYMNLSFRDFNRLKHVEEMYQVVATYARDFDQIKTDKNNSIALLARVGEFHINSIQDLEARWEMKRKHNSFGLGKINILRILAVYLLKRGIPVLFVNDTDIIAELRHQQFQGDFEELVERVQTAQLLIWDDLGKAKRSEWAINQYYRILDYRYRKRLPTCVSSNESFDTLSEKIGDAAASRLYEMCRGRMLHLEGPDYRLRPELSLVKQTQPHE